MSKAGLIPLSSEFIKEINKELYSLIWKGKGKIKRSALINDIEDGGFKMLDLESMISAQRMVCLKKYTENYDSPWKYVLDFYLRRLAGNFYYIVMLTIESYPFHFLSFIRSACKPGLLRLIMIRQPIKG